MPMHAIPSAADPGPNHTPAERSTIAPEVARSLSFTSTEWSSIQTYGIAKTRKLTILGNV